MARYTGAACRLCRREGTKLFLKGDRCFTEKCGVERRAYPPGQHGQGRTRTSDYGVQLREKQKVKRMYGLAEKQFRGTMDAASRMRGRTGENLLVLLEQRLDNVVFRLGFATSRSEARQLVRHGHFEVNGRKVDIPSFRVKAGMRVTLRESSRQIARITEALEALERRSVPRLARAREGGVHGRDQGGADARRHHDADPRAAHRRALLALTKPTRVGSGAAKRSRAESSRLDATRRPRNQGGFPMQQELIAQNWRQLIRPRRLETEADSATPRYGRFWCEPLERGFGVTLGNALRRVLLSSLRAPRSRRCASTACCTSSRRSPASSRTSPTSS